MKNSGSNASGAAASVPVINSSGQQHFWPHFANSNALNSGGI
jgi:hypothetical protein